MAQACGDQGLADRVRATRGPIADSAVTRYRMAAYAPPIRPTGFTVWYNYVRQHKTHRLSPAMAAGITDELWSMTDSLK